MAAHKIYSLYVDVYENGHRKEVADLTQDERDALCLEIEDLWMDHYRFEAHRREFIVGINHDEDMLYLITKDRGAQCAFPDDCMLREITLGAPKVNQQTLKLMGDRIPIRMPGYPGRRLEVQFSDV
jgi:hypothetical protein